MPNGNFSKIEVGTTFTASNNILLLHNIALETGYLLLSIG